MPENLENSHTGLKKSAFIPIPKKGNAKECSHYHTITLISHASEVMLKIIQAKYVNTYFTDRWTEKFQLYILGLEKAEEQRSNCQYLMGHRKKQWNSIKTSTSALLTTLNPLTVWIITNFGKFLKSWECQTTLPASWATCMQVKKQQLGADMKQQTGSKQKEVHQGCILSLCFFNLYTEYIMRNARLDETLAGIKTAGRNINNLRYADDTTLMAEGEEELKSLLMKVKEESEKDDLETQHSEN